MTTTVVMGLQWGDEGKGRIIDLISRHGRPVVVRCNGGPNAGHKIPQIGGGVKSVHQLPSAAFSDITMGVLGRGMVIDPEKLRDEIKRSGLERDGFVIDSGAHVILGWHRGIDEGMEAMRERTIGTTKTGNGPAYADKCLRTGIRVFDLMTNIEASYERRMSSDMAIQHLSDVMRNELEKLRDILIDDCPPVDTVVQRNLIEAHRNGRDITFEISHGFGLDIDHGEYPYVTSSTCGIGAVATCGFDPRLVHKVIGVMKPYSTRVGSGPIPREYPPDISDMVRKEGGEFGTTTGRPRRIGILNLDMVRDGCIANGVDELAVTHLDVAHILSFEGCLMVVADGMEMNIKADDILSIIESFVGVPVTIYTDGPDYADYKIRRANAIR